MLMGAYQREQVGSPNLGVTLARSRLRSSSPVAATSAKGEQRKNSESWVEDSGEGLKGFSLTHRVAFVIPSNHPNVVKRFDPNLGTTSGTIGTINNAASSRYFYLVSIQVSFAGSVFLLLCWRGVAPLFDRNYGLL